MIHQPCFSIGLLAATLLWAAPAAPSQPSGKPTAPPLAAAPLRFTSPKKGEIFRPITLPGNIKAYQQATLFAKVTGYLKSIKVDKGDRVNEGALLAEIEVPELIADLAKAKAEVEVAKIEFNRARDAQQKAPDLVVPQIVDNAKGKYEIAKASLERIETLLGFAKIAAPFSGIVTMRYVDVGAFIPAATSSSAAQTAAIVSVMDFSKVRVQVAVPESEASLVAAGLPVTVAVEGMPGRKFEGQITRFAYALDDASRTMLVEAELPNPKMELRPGMFASVKIGIERRADVLLLPAAAVVPDRASAFVFTLADNKAKKVAVKTGFNDGAKVEIQQGVSVEDRVLLVGKQTLTDGQPVVAEEVK